uniref:Uncharacterized protein n=1 Tax=Avena sativa TaxID=4498 RepID=A0ACD5YW44_AVESA
MEAPAEACEIGRLPEELLSAALSLTSPRDACLVAAVSRAFRAAADSDSVWACFLPRALPPLADGELAPAPQLTCKKDLFLRLSDSWMELELGEFLNEGDEDGEVSFSLMEMDAGYWKSGLVVQGIEIRRKNQGEEVLV